MRSRFALLPLVALLASCSAPADTDAGSASASTASGPRELAAGHGDKRFEIYGVTPDGYVVYAQFRDENRRVGIFAMNLTSGDATTILDDDAEQPSAVVKGRFVFAWKGSSYGSTLVVWSASSGRKTLSTKSLRTHGRDIDRIPKRSPMPYAPLAVSPDGSQVMFVTAAGSVYDSSAGGESGKKADIVLAATDGSAAVTLVHDAYFSNVNTSDVYNYNPRLDFVGDHAIVDTCQFSAPSPALCHRSVSVFDRVATAGGQGRTVLTEDVADIFALGRGTVSANGDRFAVLTTGGIASFAVSSGPANVVDAGGLKNVFDSTTSVFASITPGFALGSDLLYVNANGLARAGVGGAPRPLAAGVKGIFAVTPDGKRAIAYSEHGNGGPAHAGVTNLFIASTSTDESVAIDTNTHVWRALLSKDGTHVIYETYDPDLSAPPGHGTRIWRLWGVPVTGGAPKLLASTDSAFIFDVASGSKAVWLAHSQDVSFLADLYIGDAASPTAARLVAKNVRPEFALDEAGDRVVFTDYGFDRLSEADLP